MNDRHKQIRRLKKKYKHLAAAAIVGAAIMSSAALPGIPSATAHAASVGGTQTITAQQNISSNKLNNPIQPNYIANVQAAKQLPVKIANQPVSPAQANNVKNNEGTITPPASTNESVNPVEKPNPEVKSTEKKTSEANDVKVTADKPPVNSKQAIDMVATAYAPGPNDNDQWGDKTYMGTTVRPGVIAVDPKIIPLGSRVYIQYPDGHGEYAVAEDTGGAIKGNRIDIAMWSDNKANDFGMQKVKVYVLGKA